MMKLKFKIQQYQTDAVEIIHFEEDSAGYKNGDIVLTKDELLKNIHQVK